MDVNEENNVIEGHFSDQIVDESLVEEGDILESFFEDGIEDAFEKDECVAVSTIELDLTSKSDVILETVKLKTSILNENIQRLKYYLDEMNFSES